MLDYETVGNAQISTSVKKYGTGSLAFDGSGDYLVSPMPSVSDIGTGNFTLEFWVYTNALGTSQGLVGNMTESGTVGFSIYKQANNTIRFQYGNSYITSGGTLSASTWYHIAVSRAGTSVKVFVNGTEWISGTVSTNLTSGSLVVGRAYTDADNYYLNGYIDDLRVTKGYARYWENFTPPAAALPNFGGAYQVPTQDPQFNYTTMLLPGNGTNGAQNNTFLYSSTNAFTVTRNGNTTQGTFKIGRAHV